MASTVELQKIGEFHNPTKIAGGFGGTLSWSGSKLFVGDWSCDYADLVSGQKFAQAGAVYIYDVDLGTTSVLVSPQPRPNGIFGAQIAVNGLCLCVNEKTLDTKDQDGGVVHIFDHATLTHLATIQPPPLPRPQEGMFCVNDDLLFFCLGGYKDGIDKNFFLAGQILVVSLNPLSPTFCSVIKVINPPKDKQGGLTIRYCQAQGDVLIASFLRYANPKGGPEVSEDGFLLYDLRYLHLPDVPHKYVSQTIGTPYVEASFYSWNKINQSTISTKKTEFKKVPLGFQFDRELVGFYTFSDFDGFDPAVNPIYVQSPVQDESGFGNFVAEVPGHILVSSPYAQTLGDGSKYYGEIDAIETNTIGTPSPAIKSILVGDPMRPRVGEFAATADRLAVRIQSGKYGGIIEIYSLSFARAAEPPLELPLLSPFGAQEPIRAPADLWDSDLISVPSNPNRDELDASTKAMLATADKDGTLTASLAPIKLKDGKRTAFVQASLAARYIKHTTFNGPEFPLAELPGQSFHEYGLAIDVLSSEAAALKPALEAAGFKQSGDEDWHFTASASAQIPKAIQRRNELKPSSTKFQDLLLTSFSAKQKLEALTETVAAEKLKAMTAENEIKEIGVEIKKIEKDLVKLEATAKSLKDAANKADIALHSAKQVLANFKYTKCPNGNDFQSCTHENLKQEYLAERKVIEQKVKGFEADYVAQAAKAQVAEDLASTKKAELAAMSGKKKTKAVALAQLKQKLSQLDASVQSLEGDRVKTNAQISALLFEIDGKLSL